jgi:single-stranded DNA-binding protein
VESWDEVGRRCHAHLRKGAWVNIMGRLRVQKWQPKDSTEERKRTVLVANSVFHITSVNSGMP